MYKIRINKTNGVFLDLDFESLPKYSFDPDRDTAMLEDQDFNLIYYGRLSSIAEITVTNVLEEVHAVYARA